MEPKHIARVLLSLISVSVVYAEVEVTSLSRNGEIEWQSSESTGFYVVEWASSLSGEWNRSWPQVNVSVTGGTSRVGVPMFYRVVWDADSICLSTPVLSYNPPTPEMIKVYQGTWDSDDIRVEITDVPYIDIIDGHYRLVYRTRNYNYALETMTYAHTEYHYADDTSWILWKEVDADGTINDNNFALFRLNMPVNDFVGSMGAGVRLVESGQKVFPELGGDELEYAKLQVYYGDSFTMVYTVKGHGEYVLKYGETDDSQVQRYLIYSEHGADTVGTKPAWFDSVSYP